MCMLEIKHCIFTEIAACMNDSMFVVFHCVCMYVCVHCIQSIFVFQGTALRTLIMSRLIRNKNCLL